MTNSEAPPSVRTAFLADLGFRPDEFQVEAFDHLDEGRHVIVAAPTGAGKTLVADYAVELVLARGERLFYTTPIKALSNQKFHDLVAAHGIAQIGLLTGDNAINPDAPVVVMTTEVLRNMLYAGNSLSRLAAVVLDEVHYLQDAYRGPVWEEVIIHLPRHIQLVCLSATVSNAAELQEWIETVRGPTGLVVESRRPVDLENLYLVGERNSGHMDLIPVVRGTRPNPSGFRYDADLRQLAGGRGGGNRKAGGKGRPKWRTPTRVEVVDLLERRSLLPVIFFIFSRAACSDAAASIVGSGLVLTTQEEQKRIRSIVAERVEGLDRDDLDVLGYDDFLAGLVAGVAPHHAGMVPPFKEAVEACFVRGLIKVVFATETLALGINMPARTVVVEKLTKFTGDHHEFLTPAQYTQLTGRAGRRGIDVQGKAVVLWSPFVRFEQVADLAMSRRFVLSSSFRPTYNMAANLVRRYDQDRARQLLNLSFAQFRADAGVVRSEHKAERLVQRRDQVRRRIEKEYGPVSELRAALASGARQGSDDRQAIAFALSHLVPGQVIEVVSPEAPPVLVVLAVSFRSGGRVRVRVADGEGDVYEIGPPDLDEPPVLVGQVELPQPYLPNSVTFAHEASQALARTRLVAPKRRRSLGPSTGIVASDDVPPQARKALRRLERIEADLDLVGLAAVRRADSLAGQFDRVIALLADRGHLVIEPDGTAGGASGGTAGSEGWHLTPSGQRLARLYHECDLLVIEALEAGLFDNLNSAEVAALASCVTYEERRTGHLGPQARYPSENLRRRFLKLQGLHMALVVDENDARLTPTRAPEAGFMSMAHAWAAGGELGDVLGDEVITAGDFVRTAKQLIDLLRQIGSLAQKPATATAARVAAEAAHRDLVAASSTVDLARVAVDLPADTPEGSVSLEAAAGTADEGSAGPGSGG